MTTKTKKKKGRTGRARRRLKPKKPSRRATRAWVDQERPGPGGETVYFRLKGDLDTAVQEAHGRFCVMLEEAGLNPMSLHQLTRELLLRGMAPEHSHSESNKELDRVFARWLRA